MTSRHAIPVLPEWFSPYQRECEAFLRRYPDYRRNVFIITSFSEDDVVVKVGQEIKRALTRRGVEGIRADAHMFADQQQLWRNVCVHMLCCAQGIALIENRTAAGLNPNIAIELGFMTALGKPVLLLKSLEFRELRADFIGFAYAEFDAHRLSTVDDAVYHWLRQNDLVIHAAPHVHAGAAFKIYSRLLKLRAALHLSDSECDAELSREFWYLGAEVDEFARVWADRPRPEIGAAVQTLHQALRALPLAPKERVELTSALVPLFAQLST